jgi:hypothetical protein
VKIGNRASTALNPYPRDKNIGFVFSGFIFPPSRRIQASDAVVPTRLSFSLLFGARIFPPRLRLFRNIPCQSSCDIFIRERAKVPNPT